MLYGPTTCSTKPEMSLKFDTPHYMNGEAVSSLYRPYLPPPLLHDTSPQIYGHVPPFMENSTWMEKSESKLAQYYMDKHRLHRLSPFHGEAGLQSKDIARPLELDLATTGYRRRRDSPEDLYKHNYRDNIENRNGESHSRADSPLSPYHNEIKETRSDGSRPNGIISSPKKVRKFKLQDKINKFIKFLTF